MTGISHSSIHDVPSLLMQPSSSSSLGRSRGLEEMGAGTNEAHVRDTHVSLAHPILSCTHYFQAGYSSSSCGEKCCVSTQRTVSQNLFVSVRNLPNDNYCYAQPQNGLLVLCSTTRLHIILYQVQHHLAQLDPAPHFLCLLTVLQLQHRTNISKYRIEATLYTDVPYDGI